MSSVSRLESKGNNKIKKMKLKVLKKALKDAEGRGLKGFSIVTKEGCILKVKEISVSDVTGMIIRLKK